MEHFVRLPTVVEDSLSPRARLHMHPAKASSPSSSSRVYRFDTKRRLIKALSVPAADRGRHLPNLAHVSCCFVCFSTDFLTRLSTQFDEELAVYVALSYC